MSQRPTGLQLRQNLENQQHEEKQMTAIGKTKAGATSASNLAWQTINWIQAEKIVRRLQIRIAKATREGRYGKVKALQWLLTHSLSAKVMAVKRVAQNSGSKTPGTDGVVWKTAQDKMEAALSLKRHGYCTKPLKRIYIPKKNTSTRRPLSIPSMSCRGMQALYLLALEPVVEMMADKNAYGFRPKRSTADAIEKCFKSLCRRDSSQFILEGDIRACFDKISHSWLLNNIIMDKFILNKWLKAGYIEKNTLYPTEMGTPQGGIISPTLLNATLSGLEAIITSVSKRKDKIHVCIYADDFIITGSTQEVLEEQIKPLVKAFLLERGLELSEEKTKISHIKEGFNFLGCNVRKYGDKLLIKPSSESKKSCLTNIRQTIKMNSSVKTETLIHLLNPKIRGWANYFCHIVSKEIFLELDSEIFKALWKWCKRRHPNKNLKWIKNKYFRSLGFRNWIFNTKLPPKDGQPSLHLDLFKAGSVRIVRHVKIKEEATPYDPSFEDYFKQRTNLRKKNAGTRVNKIGLLKARAV